MFVLLKRKTLFQLQNSQSYYSKNHQVREEGVQENVHTIRAHTSQSALLLFYQSCLLCVRLCVNVCVCICTSVGVCVCANEKEREREREIVNIVEGSSPKNFSMHFLCFKASQLIGAWQHWLTVVDFCAQTFCKSLTIYFFRKDTKSNWLKRYKAKPNIYDNQW